MTALFFCTGAATAADLKVMVPVDDFKKLNARVETLEQENRQLQRAVEAGTAGGATRESLALQSQLATLEEENNQLKRQIQTMQGQPVGADLSARISALEQENSQLRMQVTELQEQDQSGTDSDMESRLAAAENENSRLRQQVRILKEGGVTASLSGDKTTARHLYASSRQGAGFYNFRF
jgi:chromosome segregation ATPase